MKKVDFRDMIFILVSSGLIFFGALFVFMSVQREKEVNTIAIEELETKMNQDINKGIQRLQGKNSLLRGRERFIGDEINKYAEKEISIINPSVEKKHEINIFQGSKDSSSEEVEPVTISEKVLSLMEKENEFALEVESGDLIPLDKIPLYKAQLIEKARKMGWEIKVNDQLEVVSAERL